MVKATTTEDLRGIVVISMGPYLAEGKAFAQLMAARDIGFSVRRVRAYWERTVKVIPFQEADRLRAWHQTWKRDRAKRLANELAVLQLQLGDLDG